jgi:hypothetical protein
LVRDAIRRLSQPVIYVCGPQVFAEGISALVVGEAGISESNVRAERFTGY